MINPLNKTEYSFRYAFGKISDIIGNTVGGSVVMADRFTTFGHIPFYKQCKKAGKKAILGVELAFVDDANLKVKQNPTHVTLLAVNAKGLEKIYQLVSKSTGQKYYYNRLDKDELLQISQEDVILIIRDKFAERFLNKRKNTFFAVTDQSLWCDIVDTQFPRVACSDNLYQTPAQESHYQMIMGNGQWDGREAAYCMSESEWKVEYSYLGDEVVNEAIRNTTTIENLCSSYDLPWADLPKSTETRSLKEICLEGAIARKCPVLTDKVYSDRLDRELELIHAKNYDEYFYLTWDLVMWAKERMLVGPARGSSAGSLVCYLMFITDVDPIPHKLIFERFIDVNRFDMPDIDIDFQDTERDKIVGYLEEKYGKECVGKLGTVSKYKPKSTLNEIAKCLGIPVWEIGALTKAIPERSGGDARASNCIEDTFTDLDIGVEMLKKYPALIVAGEIEGHCRHFGQHAAGIVVADQPLNKFCSVDEKTDGCMLDKKDAEEVNLLKMDCLGLRTLSVIQTALDLTGHDREWLVNYPLDDQKAFDVINERKYGGIFQFEGFALINVAKQIWIRDFEDISAIGALARPGPLVSGGTQTYIKHKNDPENIKYLAGCENVTKDTFGVVIYQEQLMQISREVGKLSWADTSDLRRAASKSLGEEFFGQYKTKFMAGAINESGLTEDEAEQVWASICTFGSWAFNKCLSRDTLVRMGATGSNTPQWISIEDLYEKYVSNPTAWTKSRMPVLQSLYSDGRVRPNKALKIMKSGEKECFKYSFDDGTEVKCTIDHKFLINGRWAPIGSAEVGDKFLSSSYEKYEKKGRGDLPHKNKTYEGKGFQSGKDNISYTNGKTKAIESFRGIRLSIPCEDCSEFSDRMEVHHCDFVGGDKQPHDLAWLCPSCHKKRHYKKDRTRRWEKGHTTGTKTLVAIKYSGVEETYDIEMDTHHNFIIDGGLITHNSHSISYGLISYWCMVFKAYHPLEFALATMKHAKDEAQVKTILREMDREGIKFEFFNKEKSKVDWSIQDGALIGGYINIKGVGIKKAQGLIKKRDAKKAYTVAEKKLLYNAITPYDNLFEFRESFQPFYDNWEKFLKVKPVLISDIIEGEDCRFLARIVGTATRDMNEEILVKKRGGKRAEGAVTFLDLKMEDDSELVQGRISADKFEKIGRDIAEKNGVGSYYMIHGWCCKDFKYIIIKNVKLITAESVMEKIKESE